MTATETTPAYLAFAHLIIDDLVLADGTAVTGQLGGAGTYAALGAALVSDRPVALTCGVGADLDDARRASLRAWNIDTTAMVTRGPRTPRSRVVYRPDGTRTETPVHGLEHFAAMEPRTGDVPSSWTDIRGVYVFATDDDGAWRRLVTLAARRRAAIMWEISADSCRADAFDRVVERLRDVDMFSINLAEARALCATDDPLACVDLLRGDGAAVIVLRMGAEGSLVADGDRALSVGAAPTGAVIDPTGAGNCYSGAFMAAWCQRRDAPSAAALAAAAAARVLGQYGLPVPASAERASVRSLAERVRVREPHRPIPTSTEHM
jgi:sugar/nucleoside kinase (ribokinase family)